jgi:putative oxidoreductase
MKNMISRGSAKCMNQGLGLLILRVVLGIIFIAHGWQKMQMMDEMIGFFGAMGIPAFWVYVVTYGELLSGIAMVLGIFTRLAGYVISIIMIGATLALKYKLGIGFFGGYELTLGLLASALCISLSGPGMLALGKKLCGCGSCQMCGDVKKA